MENLKNIDSRLLIPASLVLGYKVYPTIKDMIFPEKTDKMFTDEGVWVQRIGYKKYLVGVTNSILRDQKIKEIKFPPEPTIRKPHALFYIYTENEKIKVKVPASCYVIEKNPELTTFNVENSPDETWVCKIKVSAENLFREKLKTFS